MLAILPPLFFFAALMGSPVIGFLVFMLLGLWQAARHWRSPMGSSSLNWTREDTWLALCFMSIPMFKALSVLWSADPVLALQNAVWHGYFLFWPIVFFGIYACHDTPKITERALALGLTAYGIYAIAVHLSGGAILDYGRPNVGILAQLTLALGAWNLLILTRPKSTSNRWCWLHVLGLGGTLVALISSTRRLELLGFVALGSLIVLWRLRHTLNAKRLTLLIMGAFALLATLVYLRREKFWLGLHEFSNYWQFYNQDVSVKLTSWGARFEMWRTAWLAWLEHPFVGLSASARPYAMQAWGAPPPDVFGHRHFHSHFVQTLVEGGVVGLIVMFSSLWLSLRILVVKSWRAHHELSLLALTLFGSYAIEGAASAALQYDKPNAFLVVASAWLWVHLRQTTPKANPAPTTISPL